MDDEFHQICQHFGLVQDPNPEDMEGWEGLAGTSSELEDSCQDGYPDTEFTVEQRTQALVDGLLLVLKHFDACEEVLHQIVIQTRQYLDACPDEAVWLTCAKHMLAYPLAKYLRNDPPKEPEFGAFCPVGILRRWMRQRLVCFNRKNTRLWSSWFQVKRCSLPASDQFVDETYKEHFTTLSSADTGDANTIEEIFSDKTFISVLDEVKRAVTDIVGDGTQFLDFTPSGSASFEKTRAKDGQFGALRQHSRLHLNKLYPSEFTGMVEHDHQLWETYEVSGRDQWSDLLFRSKKLKDRPIRCTIQAVLEPFKVRVISKGEALPYYLCKPIQKAMHGCMRRMPCFRLIGKPLSPTHLADISQESGLKDEWFSIDYKAATDGLSWAYSGRIFRHVIADLPPALYTVAANVLGPHSLYYPPKGGMGRPVYRGEQRNGQLMGSILSFPVLCLANLGLYLRVNAERQIDWSPEQRLGSVLINGDDMLYTAPRELWKNHIELGSKIGLRMSLGKAYTHPEFAVINSVSLHMNLQQYPRPSPVWLEYLNAGLYFGRHKVQGGTDCEISGAIVPNINTVLRGSLPGKECELLRSMLTLHADSIYEESQAFLKEGRKKSRYTRNLFTPQSAGGMGVVPPPDWKFVIKPIERRILSSLKLRSASTCLANQRPYPGIELEEFQQLDRVAWQRPVSIIEKPIFELHPRAARASRADVCLGFVPLRDPTLRERFGASLAPPEEEVDLSEPFDWDQRDFFDWDD